MEKKRVIKDRNTRLDEYPEVFHPEVCKILREEHGLVAFFELLTLKALSSYWSGGLCFEDSIEIIKFLDETDFPEEFFKLEDIDMPTKGMFSERTYGPLSRAGIMTLRSLLVRTPDEIKNIKGFGTKCFEEVEAFIGSLDGILAKKRKEYEEIKKRNEKIAELSEEVLDYSVERLDLSVRATNALMNNEIRTIRDLLALSDEELKDLKQLGAKAVDEIKDKLLDLSGGKFSFVSKEFKTQNMGLDVWMNEKLKPNYVEILVDFYGLLDGKRKNLREVADSLGISHERVRQIKQKALKKLKRAIDNGCIDQEMLKKFDDYAEKQTKLQDINDLSEVYNNTAVARLLGDVARCHIFKNDWYFNSEWLVKDEVKLLEDWQKAKDWLDSQTGFVPLDELVKQSGVSRDKILDIKNVKLDDGYVAIVDARRKDGVDRAKVVKKIMQDEIRPMTIDEIAKKTGFDRESLRGLIYRIPGVVNVGNSIFALEEFGYSDKDSRELAIEYLKACGEPRHIDDIVKYVLHRRVVEAGSVQAAIYINTKDFTRFENGFVALAEWGYESDAKKKITYEVPTREAVLGVLKENPERALSIRDISNEIVKKYGDKATSVMVTIGMEAKKMAEEGIVDVLGTKTYYYRLKERK